MITSKEYELLKKYQKQGYKWIARDKSKELCVYEIGPTKSTSTWLNFNIFESFDRVCDNDRLFPYIKWQDEKPTLIKDLINDYESHETITNKSEKVIVPQFIGRWIEGIRAILGHVSLFDAYDELKDDIGDDVRVSEKDRKMAVKICRWIYDNPNTFIDAWRDGYEVEKEKLYTVRLANGDCLCRFKSVGIDWAKGQDYRNDKEFQLTQAEIESIDPILMRIAEEVING